MMNLCVLCVSAVEELTEFSPTLFIDADSCPVKEEAIEVARRFGVGLVFVSAQKHPRLEGRDGILVIDAGPEFQAADKLILEKISPGDALVTADLELAREALIKGCSVCGYEGELSSAKISDALELRDLYQAVREHGTLNPKKNRSKAFSKSDRSAFKAALHGMLESKFRMA